MITPPKTMQRNKFLENLLLVLAGLAAHAPLYYQLPRWANGLNPTFVHPAWMEHSHFPIVLHMARIHPIIWIVVMGYCFIRICRNYGWKLPDWRSDER